MLSIYERFDCIVPALITAGGSVLGGAIGAGASMYATRKSVAAQERMNAQNIALQRETNAMQLDLAKNAYTYATADRMNAGLSPLDTQPASVPSLTAPQGQAPDHSGIGQAGVAFGGALASGLNSAVQAYQQDRSISSQVDYNNAQSASAMADSANKLIDAEQKLASFETTVELQKEKLKELKTSNSSLAQRLEKQIEESEARINELKDLVKRQNAMLPHQINLTDAQTVEATSRARSNNAQAYEQEQQNEAQTKLRIPPSVLKTVNTSNPQSMLLYNAWLSLANSRDKDSAIDQTDVDSAYRFYVNSWTEAKQRLTADIKAYNSSNHSGNAPTGQSWQDYRKELASQEKSLGSKPMSLAKFRKTSGF